MIPERDRFARKQERRISECCFFAACEYDSDYPWSPRKGHGGRLAQELAWEAVYGTVVTQLGREQCCVLHFGKQCNSQGDQATRVLDICLQRFLLCNIDMCSPSFTKEFLTTQSVSLLIRGDKKFISIFTSLEENRLLSSLVFQRMSLPLGSEITISV